MKAILAIARGEILRNWKLVAIPLSAVLGVLVLAAMGTQQSDRTFAGSLMGILIIFGFPLAVVPAIVLGLNLFGPDIRQRKLSFYLTRPCPPWQLFLGRLMAASLIAGVGWLGIVVVLPFMGVVGSFSGGGSARSTDAIAAALGLAGFLLVMNALAMVLAANSPRWFVADIAAGAAFGAATIWSLGRALYIGGPRYVVDSFVALTFLAVLALCFAALAYLSFGRGDGPAGHRAHSLILWAFGLMGLAGLFAHRSYEWSRSLASMFPPGSARAVGPDTALITVFESRNTSSFLLNTRTGEPRRLPGFASFWGASNLKSGLHSYVEERLDPTGGSLLANYLVISSVASSGPPLVDRPIPRRLRRLMDLGSGGRRAIFATWNGFEVIDTQSGEPEFRYANSPVDMAVFQDDGTILAMAEERPAKVRLSILGADGKVVSETRFPMSGLEWEPAIHTESGRVGIISRAQGVGLHERDGTLVAQLAPEVPEGAQTFRGQGYITYGAALFTRGGDFIVAGAQGLRVVRRGETQVRLVPLVAEGVALPLAGGRSIVGELESGDLVVSAFHLGEYTTLLVDPVTGIVRLSLKGHKPLTRRERGFVTGVSSPSADSGLRLLQNDDGDIVFLDPGGTKPRLLVKSTKEDR